MDNEVHFEIPTRPFDPHMRLYSKKDLYISPGLTTLVGCNGSGKSTLLKLLASLVKVREDAKILEYNDRINGGTNLMEKMMFENRINEFATMMFSSEGERIFQGVGNIISTIGRVSHRDKPKELWVLMDAIGSGLSIDNIQEIKDIVPFMQEQAPDVTLYFIVATNEYEFTVGCSQNIDVTTFNHKIFKNYESYKKFILKTREKKDRRNW